MFSYNRFIFTGILFFSFSIAYSQNCLKGIITDSKTGKPLVGATVKIEGRQIGTITDNEGFFIICEDSPDLKMIVLQHIGYKSIMIEKVATQETMYLSLEESPYPLDKIVVTATLIPQPTWDVPALVSVVDNIKIQSESALNTDNYLRTIPGLYIDRSNGVFSKNASVTMRGLDGSNRVLILYDGAPLNKTSYGFINWSLISPDLVDQIEVVHGPSSALFGNNAMAGVINIRTKDPIDKPLYGSITGEAGGFGLYGIRANLGGKLKVANREILLLINGFLRDGKGYIIEPIGVRDSTSVPSYLTEKGLTFKSTIPTSDSSKIYISGNLYEDKRGGGRSVYIDDGSFDAYTTNRIRFGYSGLISNFDVDIYGYTQREYYFRQNENLSSAGEYKLFHTFQTSGDIGIWANARKRITSINHLIFGLDIKNGWMDAEDIYRTSTDDIVRKGKVNFAAAFIQDEINFFNSRLRVLGGLRFDIASFYDGLLNVKDPTKNTGFHSDTVAIFNKSSWKSLNPKLGLRYNPNKWFSFYGSIASGFMPAKLDDLCSSRKITKGFKLANPNLKPEHLLTYEIGSSIKYSSLIRMDIALFFSRGSDFQYFLSTGDSIDTGSGEFKPIVRRENITSVEVHGGEFSLSFNPFRWLVVRGNYSFNSSRIVGYHADPAINLDLKGKALAEVPIEQGSAEIVVTNKFVNGGLVWNFIGPQWGDEVNSYRIKSWNTFNLRLWREFNSFKFIVDVQDLLNNPYIDKKGLISPGRYIQLSLTYSII